MQPLLDSSRRLAIGWAAFLGCSWTWCIGMYLPVLLVRDFGVAGWFVFAAPNVIGAAAMGWVLQQPRAAAELARRHWHACVAFSIVTILFHAFFIGWIARQLVGDAAEAIVLAAAGGFYLLGQRGRRDLPIAAAVIAISIIAFIVALSLPPVRPHGPIGMLGTMPAIWLAPVCVFGFFLCPYLDLTFLRARASTASLAGVAAFTIGFGIFFLAMIVFTLWYAPLAQPGRLATIPRVLAWVLALHMILQTAFTIAVHARAISEDPKARRPIAIALAILALCGAFLLGVWGERRPPVGHGKGEMIYRLFMAFYGLAFPAYVWVCMLPRRRPIPRRRELIVLAISIVVAAPFYWMGFIEERMAWLAPGLALLLLGRPIVGMRKQ